MVFSGVFGFKPRPTRSCLYTFWKIGSGIIHFFEKIFCKMAKISENAFQQKWIFRSHLGIICINFSTNKVKAGVGHFKYRKIDFFKKEYSKHCSLYNFRPKKHLQTPCYRGLGACSNAYKVYPPNITFLGSKPHKNTSFLVAVWLWFFQKMFEYEKKPQCGFFLKAFKNF